MDFFSSYLTKLWDGTKNNTITKLITMYGLFKFIKYTYQFLRWIKVFFLRLTSDLRKKYGDGWVVITGATGGVGFAIASEMIKKGMTRLVLISTSLKKLNLLKTELEKQKSEHTIEIELVEYDFQRDYTQTDVAELETKLVKYLPNIAILINNIGKARVSNFDKTDFKVIKTLISTNIYSTIFITQIIIKSMVIRKEKSLIVGIGSGAVLIAPRYLHLFVGAQGFMNPFFSSLRDEFTGKIDFTYCHSGPVKSSINIDDINLPYSIESSEFANHLMTKIGIDNETFVNPFNAFFHMIIKNSVLFNRVMKSHMVDKLETTILKREEKINK